MWLWSGQQVRPVSWGGLWTGQVPEPARANPSPLPGNPGHWCQVDSANSIAMGILDPLDVQSAWLGLVQLASAG